MSILKKSSYAPNKIIKYDIEECMLENNFFLPKEEKQKNQCVVAIKIICSSTVFVIGFVWILMLLNKKMPESASKIN